MHLNFFDISVLPNLSLPAPPGSDEISGWNAQTGSQNHKQLQTTVPTCYFLLERLIKLPYKWLDHHHHICSTRPIRRRKEVLA